MDLPQPLKPINIYLKIADEYNTRDTIIAYYCRLHALQEGIKINKSDKGCLSYLTTLMDTLEKMKVQLKGNEAIGNDIVGQAYVESQALKLFVFADSEDRKANFGKNVIKAFFTASILFDVLKLFGPLSDEIEQQKKYAKWKATYINDCQKKGITPKSGPIDSDITQQDHDTAGLNDTHSSTLNENITSDNLSNMNQNFLNSFKPNMSNNVPCEDRINSQIKNEKVNSDSSSNSNLKLSPDMVYIIDPNAFSNAERLCKFAHSALQYEDITTAISNLQECLKILIKMKRQ